MKKDKKMMVLFLGPVGILFAAVFVYPIIRTIMMSFFAVERPSMKIAEWSFNGFDNYMKIFESSFFKTSMVNLLKIWLIGGIFVLCIALLFAVILTSKIRFSKFYKAAIYVPNVISAVAVATMWIYYVYNQRFGLLHNIFAALGLEELSKTKWLGADMIFWAMLFAFCFSAVGYYMLIFISGIEKIPSDLYEAVLIDGAGKFKQFWYITLPLLKGVFKTNITFWTINTTAFFVWTKMFSPIQSENGTIVPLVYMYEMIFGSKTIRTTDAGAGAAIGCVLTVCVMIVFLLINRFIKDDDLEY